MFDIKKATVFASVLLCAVTVSAQSLSSAYFLSGSYTRQELNPALTPERAYFSLPVLGGFELNANSNVGLSNFVYNSTRYPGKLTSFMSADVDGNTFLSALKNRNSIGSSSTIELLSTGFSQFGGYTTIGLKLKDSEELFVPKEFFAFMKAGLSDGQYLIEDLNTKVRAYADLQLGHSRKIGDNLRVGARIHVLAGLGFADLNVKRMNAVSGAAQWCLSMDAEARVNGFKLQTKDDGTPDFDKVKYQFQGITGIGMALDLGAEYNLSDFVDGLKLSASVTDLGFMNWSEVQTFATNPNDEFTFDGFHGVADEDELNRQSDEIGERLEALATFHETDSKSYSAAPAATFRIGAQYCIPGVRWLSAGELLTIRTGSMSMFESRTSVNFAPFTWFDASLNVAFSTYGTALGWIVNFHPNGINFFVGSDGFRAKLNKNSVPLNDCTASIMAGLRFPLGQLLDM